LFFSIQEFLWKFGDTLKKRMSHIRKNKKEENDPRKLRNSRKEIWRKRERNFGQQIRATKH
jgi:hypothetical protein